MSPKDGKYFFNDKILIRQIVGETFLAAIDRNNFIADQTLYTCILNENDKENLLEFFLAVINSKLYGFYFRKYFSEEDDLFPKIKVNELKKLPFKITPPKQQKTFSKIVKQIMVEKNSNSREKAQQLESKIDQLVYELYGLTEEEIRVVEGGNTNQK